MARKYCYIRVNLEDYNKIVEKKNGLKKDMEAILNKKIKFSNPDFMRAFANGVLEINPDYAIQLFKIRRIKTL